MNSQVITVGVDGSKSSAQALRFALGEARVRGASVRAVTAWQADAVYAAYGAEISQDDHAAHQRGATEVQNKSISAILQDMDDVPTIERRIVRGNSGQALVELSRDAAMLVVGTEHKGLVKRVALGSTSAYCTKFAKVPVVVVPFVSREHQGLES